MKQAGLGTVTCKILVVEDEIFVATEFENIIEDLGHEAVGIASDSRSARELGKLAQIAFVDLNLLDGATGATIGRDLAASGVTVVFVTANPRQLGDGVPGTVGVIAKPITDIEMQQAVRFAVAKHLGREDDVADPPTTLKLFDFPMDPGSVPGAPLSG